APTGSSMRSYVLRADTSEREVRRSCRVAILVPMCFGQIVAVGRRNRPENHRQGQRGQPDERSHRGLVEALTRRSDDCGRSVTDIALPGGQAGATFAPWWHSSLPWTPRLAPSQRTSCCSRWWW